MSDADKTLKNLGYREIEELKTKKEEVWGIKYTHYRDDVSITFDLIGKEVCVSNDQGEAVYFPPEELKAINKKIKELDF